MKRSPVGSLDALARLIAARAGRVLILALAVLAIAAGYGLGVFGSLVNGGFDTPHSDSARELAAAESTVGNQAIDVVAIYADRTASVDDPSFRRAVRRTIAGYPPGAVSTVTDYYSTGSPALVSRSRHQTQVLISLHGKTQQQRAHSYDLLKPHLRGAGSLTTRVTGQFAVFGDVQTTVTADLARAEAISLPLVLLLSLLIFGSVTAALMPVLTGATAVLGAMAVVRLITGVSEVSVFAINVITLLGMGLAIDYALFMISRFREELAALPLEDPDAPATAVIATMRTAGRTVLFSGLTVTAALASLLVFPVTFLRSLGFGGMAAVVVAMLAALTILPAILRLLGRRIDGGRMPWARHRPVRVTTHGGAWGWIAHSVMRRPVSYLLVIVLVLVALAIPFLGVRWGSVDYRALPPGTPSYVGAESLLRDFGPEQSSADVLVREADAATAKAYAGRLGTVPGVRSVQPVAQQPTATLLRVTWLGNTQSERSRQLVADLRGVPTPPGSSVLIGGASAEALDLISTIGSRLPAMVLIVVLVMLVVLFLAFGSVVLPVKAISMNTVSIGASFGVVTWIFADGHLEQLLGFTSPGYLDATQPILMLAVLFGLSMDYEVFLLSRVREEWDRTGDNTEAVATGVQRTGRIITSAALLLAVVIGAFALSGLVFMKLIGIGMLVALLLDATVVRALLVPATMKLLGRWNWWAPGVLRRFWERHGFREGEQSHPLPH